MRRAAARHAAVLDKTLDNVENAAGAKPMKATLTFTLPDEQGEYDAARLGRDALTVLWDIDQHCRSILKHGDPSDAVRKLCETLRAKIPSEMLDI
jgi:hypothetical protein